ncbi:MAG: TROVE domain-containing protein [Myxococcota bacterium]
MSMRYVQHLIDRFTPQHQKARKDQKRNLAGGYCFVIDKWAQLERFLILGAEGGSYYATERAMTRDNAKCVQACLDEDGLRTVATIVEISDKGRAPKNDPAIFALAMAASYPRDDVRRAALAALPKVCRIGTHLFHFAGTVTQMRRWGRGLRRAVGDWYNQLPPQKLSLQVAKYAQRDGWSHRDLLRLSHPKAASATHNAVYRWVVAGGSEALEAPAKRGTTASREHLPEWLTAFETLRATTRKREVVELIRAYGFTHEMIPTQWKNEVEVWEALLDKMPMTALIRNLAKMTEVGLFAPLSDAAVRAAAMLRDPKRLRGARVHPLALLNALKVYEQGHGFRGSLHWKPVREITDALEDAFYASFGAIEPTGKRHLLALDVSGSMTWGTLSGMPGINPRVGSAAMAMVTARTEQRSHFVGFSHELVPIGISAKQSLEQVLAAIGRVSMGGTDCAQPMLYAKEHRIAVDTFVVYTDNETWAGGVHPFQALQDYRQASGIFAKLIVVGMTATKFSIADPTDPGMLDVVGFDLAAPAVMADFARN